MACEFKIYSTGTASTIELNDLGLEPLSHPIDDLDLIVVYGLSLNKISRSKNLRGYIRDGHLTAKLDNVEIDADNIDDSGMTNFHKHNYSCVGGVANAIETIINNQKNEPNGIAGVDSNGKIPLDLIPIDGDLNYQGLWDAVANNPAIPDATAENNGYLYIVCYIEEGNNTEIDGFSDWEIGDWLVSNGSVWERKPDDESVESVAGKKGVVVLEENDITNLDKYSQNETDNLLDNKANTVHNHIPSDITNLDSAISNNDVVQANTNHRNNQNNPHNVLKSQLDLGNVTNDAQLKRSAGDFGNFNEKSNPENEDRVLIENSSNGFGKNWVKLENLPGGTGGSVKSLDFSYREATAVQAEVSLTSSHDCSCCLGTILFAGSNFYGDITSIRIIACVLNGSAQFRVMDTTNNKIICTSSTVDNKEKQIIDLGEISNVPINEAMFEIQTKRISGSKVRIRLYAISIRF